MPPLDFSQLSDELDGADSGPTVAEVARLRRHDELLARLVDMLARPAPAPVVTVMPEVTVPEPTVTVQLTPQPVLKWVFEFVRNADGTVQRLVATAQHTSH